MIQEIWSGIRWHTLSHRFRVRCHYPCLLPVAVLPDPVDVAVYLRVRETQAVEGLPNHLGPRLKLRMHDGIGAGGGCDGQILVLPDMLGLNSGFEPRFLRRFAELGSAASAGVESYVRAVRAGEYPAGEHTFE